MDFGEIIEKNVGRRRCIFNRINEGFNGCGRIAAIGLLPIEIVVARFPGEPALRVLG